MPPEVTKALKDSGQSAPQDGAAYAPANAEKQP